MEKKKLTTENTDIRINRRKDGSRSQGDEWVGINTELSFDKIINAETMEDVSIKYSIQNSRDFSSEMVGFFLQFAIIPVVNERGKKGLICDSPFKRVPLSISKENTDFIILTQSSECKKMINKFEGTLTEGEAKSGQNISPMDYIKKMLAKVDRLGSSDVSINWRSSEVIIKYEVNGTNKVLHEEKISLEYAEAIRNSLINMANENSYDHIIDGKFFSHTMGERMEYRISSIPTAAGHSIVIRSYQKFNSEQTLHTLGYLAKPLSIIENIVYGNSHGLFLITGPTGSGKTTTIYSLLQQLFQEHNYNIKTAEDPVEIQIDGIDQCQINTRGEEKHQITYTNLIRSFLRQKPRVIAIGEIRDFEVAKATVEAALTGHVVISTLHTNNIRSTFTRLMDTLGISKDRVEDSVSGVLSQRLIKKLCDCKLPDGKHFLANAAGCSKCENGDTGYNGMVVACEVASMFHGDDNYMEDNYLEYYSYAECAKELLDAGLIDEYTAKTQLSSL